MPYYHGSGSLFYEFDKKRIGQNYTFSENSGFFFTQKKQSAKNYAFLSSGGKSEGYLYEVELTSNNPLEISTNSDYYQPADIFDIRSDDLIREAEQNSHDGILIKGTRNDDLLIVFEPSQIKIISIHNGNDLVYTSTLPDNDLLARHDFEDDYGSMGM